MDLEKLQKVEAKGPAPMPAEVRLSPAEWLKKNLFFSWFSSILTVVLLAAAILLLKNVLGWTFFTARWEVISANFKLFMVGQYPLEQLWRVWTSLLLVSLFVGITYGAKRGISNIMFFSIGAVFLVAMALPFISGASRIWLIGAILALAGGFVIGNMVPFLKKFAGFAWILCFVLVLFFIQGFGILPEVRTNTWGGLMLTMLLAVIAIVFSFPIGVMFALGRASKLPIIRMISVVYIEIIRGVPLITILFMAQIMVPLFLPGGVTVDNVVRAMVGLVIFNSAYIAENVRGGLQAVPNSQIEASHALGLSTLKTTVFVVLPQALRVTIPSMVGQSISILKDTTLVATVGLLDVLGIGRTVISNPEFLGTQKEVFVFVALVFWIICFTMSVTSRKLERSLSVGHN
ncbi:amino acid ABC transporter permease [Alkalicoccobacillus murimartini]|uniref:General L-amino acid transport system permease protein n=1 Tax=Alkalicoccobacillus murimartini TaxID=171685 RepID=A0ABT9YK79_9BACI|nr:amino acid ABC transporter permease [Alkalicoccobacillus murimartini]MDQ0208059.1 general L-amino acid transport system permease protein [Alkalicoccobacillus murimartini]